MGKVWRSSCFSRSCPRETLVNSLWSFRARDAVGHDLLSILPCPLLVMLALTSQVGSMLNSFGQSFPSCCQMWNYLMKSSWPHSSSEIMWNRSWNLVLRHPLSSPVIGSIPSLPLLPFPSVCIMLLGEKLIFSLLNHGSEVSYFAVFVFVSDQNHCRP